MSFGAEKVRDIGGVQEGLNKLGHGGLVTELTGVTFYGAQTGVSDDTVGECGLANTWWSVQKDDDGSAGRGLLGPGQEGSIMVSVY